MSTRDVRRATGTTAVIAVDLGGTTAKGAVVDANGVVRTAEARSTAVADPLKVLAELVCALRDSAEAAGLRAAAASVVSPGIIDEATGTVRYSAHLNWRDLSLQRELERRCGLPVAVGQDVRIAGLAERRFGAAQGTDDFVLIQLGTGVAAALVTSGTAVRGIGGAGGEFGHMPAVPGGETCPCGQRGCLEHYVSGSGLTRRYAARTGTPLTAEEIVARRDTDPVAAAIWVDAVDVLAHGIVSLTMLFDPSVVVIGGGVSRAGEVLLRPLRGRVADLLAWRAAPSIEGSPLRAGGSAGAALIAFDAAGISIDSAQWTRRGSVAERSSHQPAVSPLAPQEEALA